MEALSTDPFASLDTPALIGRVFDRTQDFGLRMACLDSLGHMHSDQAKSELMRLAQNPNETDFWRAASQASIRNAPETMASGAGQF